MLFTTLILALPPFAPVQQASTIPPQAATWQELRLAFPKSWEFPRRDAKGRDLDSSRFEKQVMALALEPLGGAAAGPDAVFLGDLIHACRALAWDPYGIRILLDGLPPSVPERDKELLLDLLSCVGLNSPEWNPGEEKDDAILFGPTWDLPEDYWLDHGGSRSVEQAAILVLADLEAIKAAEHDFPSYFQFPDNDYLEVRPKPGTHLRIKEGDTPCMAATLDVRFRSDLPFPFSTYSLDLAILHRKTGEEDLTTFVFGRGEDLHWLAGYDRFWTIQDRTGAPVATLLVRQLAFDIAGVPDKSKHRRLGIRSGLGNLRRNSEAAFDGEWPQMTPEEAGIPDFSVKAPSK
ncbi:MAG: hypothetical protein ACYSU1_02260 [Planctomycetota bacterium]|jgi:hypothetical protein